MINEDQFFLSVGKAFEAGVSASDVSESLGVHPKTVRKWEQATCAPLPFSRELIVEQISRLVPRIS